MPDNTIDEDLESLALFLRTASAACERVKAKGGRATDAEGDIAIAAAALDRIRAAWPKGEAFPIAAPSNAIFDKYSNDLGEGAVHVIFVAYPASLPSVEAAYDLSRRQGAALRKLADALERVDAMALADVLRVRAAAKGEPS